jgi:hypothetical protein
MKFELTTTGFSYNDEAAEKLQSLGFEFRDVSPCMFILSTKQKLTKEISIEINSLEELMAFSEKWGELVISHNPPGIEIYDDYRE